MSACWGRKVARLPDRGTLIAATDLQGNRADYETLKSIYRSEEEQGNEPYLLFCGDMVHGPGTALADPLNWPEHLGSFYIDESVDLIVDYERFAREARTICLLGNHEHAHIGGPVVSKFHADEAAILDAALGEHMARIHDFIRSFPLIAVSPCGATFTHGAPRDTEDNLEDFEKIEYTGYDSMSVQTMYETGTLGALLWARYAEPERAREFLAATSCTSEPNGFVAFGHDVVREGFEKIGEEQICVSTSFGLFDEHKVYLRLDLSARYRSVHDLKIGREILPLYPDATPA